MSDPKIYTVGWICAISTEYVAAQAFLDEVHNSPTFVSPHDNNDYALGKFGNHNVVIAVLPDGEYGTNSAVGVARDMLHSFPNVRFGLMVGIGGGVPTKHDIRLGDVVVSAPRDNHGGVFQYDFGKSIQDCSFQTTGFLNQPPTILRTAISGLRSRYEMDGHQIVQNIDTVLEKKPKLKRKYKKPDSMTDRLYYSDYVHVSGGDDDCVSTCGSNPTDLIIRSTRGEEEDDPAIHYGVIASANQLMKDAILRDKLAIDNNILCFEMEAAGLMNHFPCLVVRGICDYADSHKNKAWQGYAAMTAAAYAKDLLCRISPTRVEAEKRIADLLSDVLESAKKTETGVESIKQRLDNQEDLKVLDWLTPIDYGPVHSDTLRRREPGTGQWLLDSPEYQDWLGNDKHTLFCPGIPGAGKTVLTSVVVEDLNRRFSSSETFGIAYIYCNFRRQHEQSLDDLFASLVKQLSQQLPCLSSEVTALFDLHKPRRTRPSIEELEHILQAVIAEHLQIFVVVDALDECQASLYARSEFLAQIFQLQKEHRIKLFATSRIIPDICDHFRDSMQLEIRARKEDVLIYLQHNTHPKRFFLRTNEQLQEDVREAVAEAADGMFLLAQLHFESVMAKMTEADLRNAIKNLSKGFDAYDQAYDDALLRIQDQGTDAEGFAKQLLMWIVFTYRPLKTREVQVALSVRLGQSEYDESGVPDIRDLLSACAGLVTIDAESDTVRLVHYTTQQYFERTRERWFPETHTRITALCVTYLSFTHTDEESCETYADLRILLQSCPLLDYAANNWIRHAHESSYLPEGILTFLQDKAKVYTSTLAMPDLTRRTGDFLYQISRYRNWRSELLRPWSGVTGVHLAIHLKSYAAVELLLNHGHPRNECDDKGYTPLHYAVRKGASEIVKLLLDRGYDPHLSASNGETPFSLAAARGYTAIMEILLKKATNLSASDAETSFSLAAAGGHAAIMEMLLKKANINPDLPVSNRFTDDGECTPLSNAACEGQVKVVALLLSQPGIDVNRVSINTVWHIHNRTPLSYASEAGHMAVVGLLLQHPNIRPDHPITGTHNHDSPSQDLTTRRSCRDRTPLSYAAQGGFTGVAKLLLKNAGVNPESECENRRTPLSYAAQVGSRKLVKLLLVQKGVNPDSRCCLKRTPLSYAAHQNRKGVVKLLLSQSGVNPESRCSSGRTPLSYAAEAIDLLVVQALLEWPGVDPDTRDQDNCTPLLYALGHEILKGSSDDSDATKIAVVKLLLEKSKIHPDSHLSPQLACRTPLSMAASLGYTEIVELLLSQEDIDPDHKSDCGRTPLSYAAQCGRARVVELLLKQKNVNANTQDAYGITALLYAATSDNAEVVQLLLDHGASPNSIMSSGNIGHFTPLTLAITFDCEEMVEYLLLHPDINPYQVVRFQDDFDEKCLATPWMLACSSSSTRIAKLLAPWYEKDNPAIPEQLRNAFFTVYSLKLTETIRKLFDHMLVCLGSCEGHGMEQNAE